MTKPKSKSCSGDYSQVCVGIRCHECIYEEENLSIKNTWLREKKLKRILGEI